MDELKKDASAEALKRRQCLSALADGEARGDEAAQACTAWREDEQARADWHAYALIGDVLRSDDLAHGAHDAPAFLSRLRERMAHEPVVLAPAETPVPAAAVQVAAAPIIKRHWGAPMAMAAGVLTVVGVAAVMRGMTLPEAPVTVAELPVTRVVEPASTGPVRQVEALVANGVAAPLADSAASAFVHDPEIDRYLNAHRQYARGAILAMPGGVRQVAASPSGR